MRVVIDIEANGLYNPTKIWLVVCKDIDTGQYHIFRNLENEPERLSCIDFLSRCDLLIGHNYLSYDGIHLQRIAGHPLDVGKVLDTLVVSKLVDYPRSGHSVEDYGIEFGMPKGFQVEDGSILESKYFPISFYSQYSKDLENYCIRDVDITHRIYNKYLKYLSEPAHHASIRMEHEFELVCNQLHDNGFAFNTKKATTLLTRVTEELGVLDKQILDAFPPRLKFIREITPKETKYGTISLTSIPKSMREDISDLTVGAPFCYCSWSVFNPSSHKQIVHVLNEAGWRPVDKTETHKDTERAVNSLKYRKKDALTVLTLEDYESKLNLLRTTGWKVNETNLETLPPSAPLASRLLAKRILLESRRRTLTEWLDLCLKADHGDDDKSSPGLRETRIHGKFYGIGAWTHRMAHQKPNTANIPNVVKVSDGSKTLYGKELRALWMAPKGRLLVGVDAEAIQLRIFAHLINDPQLTDAIVNGNKSEGTDPHSLNQKYFGAYCKTRNAAKHSLYAMFFGGGPNKIAEIMGCTREQAEEAIASLSEKYPGLSKLQKEVIPQDAQRGYLVGIDGRKVRIPSETVSGRKHLWMSGALQNGEAVVMKRATLKWINQLKDYNSLLVDLVHDEWQTEVPNDMKIALSVASLQADSLRIVGEELKLNCPLAGSYWNDDDKDYTIATNWSKTH